MSLVIPFPESVCIIDLTLGTQVDDLGLQIQRSKGYFMHDFIPASTVFFFIRTDLHMWCEPNLYYFINTLTTLFQIYDSLCIALAFIPSDGSNHDGEVITHCNFCQNLLSSHGPHDEPQPTGPYDQPELMEPHDEPEPIDGEYHLFYLFIYCRPLSYDLPKDAHVLLSQKCSGSPLTPDHGKQARSIPHVSRSTQTRPCSWYDAPQHGSCIKHTSDEKPPSHDMLLDECKFTGFHWFHLDNPRNVGGFAVLYLAPHTPGGLQVVHQDSMKIVILLLNFLESTWTSLKFWISVIYILYNENLFLRIPYDSQIWTYAIQVYLITHNLITTQFNTYTTQ